MLCTWAHDHSITGVGMLGYRVGDVFEWDTPAGKASLRVEEILYQPESAGVFD